MTNVMAGGQGYEELNLNCTVVPGFPVGRVYHQIQKLFEGHFGPPHSVFTKWCQLSCQVQLPDESIKDSIMDLKNLARYCEFDTFLKDALRDRLIASLRNGETQHV